MAEPDDLDALDLEADIGSREGLDNNHMARGRLQYLTAQHDSLVKQFQFADAKAGVLITLMGLLALQGPYSIGWLLGADSYASPALKLYAVLALTANAACLVIAILAVIPRFPDAAGRKALAKTNRFSWPALAAMTEDGDYAGFMRTAQASHLVASLARANQAMAVILLKKYRYLRLAFWLAFAVVATLALPGLAALA